MEKRFVKKIITNHPHAHKMWHDDELYHIRKGMPYTGE